MSDIDKLLSHMEEETYTFQVPLLSNQKNKIDLRTIKTKDQKSLVVDTKEAETELDKLAVLIKLIDKCIIKNPVAIENMLFEDFLWLLIKLRSKSFGEILNLKSNCKYCSNTNNDISINLEKDIIINYLNDLKNFEISLTPTIKLTLGYITIKEALEILRFTKEEDQKAATFAAMIKQIELKDEILDIESIEDKLLFLDELSETDLQIFIDFIEKNKFGITIKSQITCNNKDCVKINEFEINGFQIIDFF